MSMKQTKRLLEAISYFGGLAAAGYGTGFALAWVLSHAVSTAVATENVFPLSSRAMQFIEYVAYPMTAKLTADGNLDCIADDYGDCGVSGDVLMLDDAGKRVWRMFGSYE